jgi:hypothetical protein
VKLAVIMASVVARSGEAEPTRGEAEASVAAEARPGRAAAQVKMYILSL